ncbi:hypothetical protein [Flagellimonas allohymeniacidonis]|uniref:Class I SAM-dependent methyltransferase n=1 Tax=Flagellimonas allohymeniacidonis TaxID=2517819 RepID=A0A4Q8QKL1_9FLAO|nr:hypothetical protein [Allomuricauda hymeniacidonis]TAI48776.1 hypothetical protein EW142_02960 [Allomuricauda hymeniacidonis]
MKRIELFEFEDFNWLPKVVRNGATGLIKVLHSMMGTSEVIAQLILKTKQKSDFDQIIDLGSGSGGPMLDVITLLNEKREEPLRLILTDLHPNAEIISHLKEKNLSHLSYHEAPVDASNLSVAPAGLKTMIASFHHMSPKTAQNILQSAEKSNESILIYELAKNNVPLLVWVLLLPISLLVLMLMTWGMTPFVKNLSFKQVIFTYLIPLIPLVYAWDGQASLMRTYTFKDIEQLLGSDKSKNYKWSIGDAKKANGKNLGYYIMGHPVHEQG